MQALRLDDIVIRYADEGDPDGLPVVFSNSLGTDFRVWDRLAARLPSGLRLIRYDTRGHGLTTAVAPPCTMARLADDLAGLLDHLGVRGAVVVGLSIGGMIAQSLAARRPDLVRALVLMDTAAKIGDAALWQARIAAAVEGGVAALADATMQRWFPPSFHAARPDEVALWRAMMVRTPVMGWIACATALRDADLTAATAALRLPVLAMAGDGDLSTPPALVAATAALIPGAQMEVIADAGHLPCIDKPDVVAALISEFLRENELI